MMSNNLEICGRCGKTVYYAERKIALDKVWHKQCFTCAICNRIICSHNFNSHLGEIYCKQCYTRGSEYGFDLKKHGFDRFRSGGITSKVQEEFNIRPSDIKNAMQMRRCKYRPPSSNSTMSEESEAIFRARHQKRLIKCPDTYPKIKVHSRNNYQCQQGFGDKRTKSGGLSPRNVFRHRASSDDSAYDTENNKNTLQKLYHKLIPFKCPNCDCDDPYDSPQPKKLNRYDANLKIAEQYRSEKKHRQKQLPHETEELLFKSESGTVKIVKITKTRRDADETSDKRHNEENFKPRGKFRTIKPRSHRTAVKPVKPVKVNEQTGTSDLHCHFDTCTRRKYSKTSVNRRKNDSVQVYEQELDPIMDHKKHDDFSNNINKPKYEEKCVETTCPNLKKPKNKKKTDKHKSDTNLKDDPSSEPKTRPKLSPRNILNRFMRKKSPETTQKKPSKDSLTRKKTSNNDIRRSSVKDNNNNNKNKKRLSINVDKPTKNGNTRKKTNPDIEFSPADASTPVKKPPERKKPRKNDEFASVDDFNQPIMYTVPKRDQVARKSADKNKTRQKSGNGKQNDQKIHPRPITRPQEANPVVKRPESIKKRSIRKKPLKFPHLHNEEDFFEPVVRRSFESNCSCDSKELYYLAESFPANRMSSGGLCTRPTISTGRHKCTVTAEISPTKHITRDFSCQDHRIVKKPKNGILKNPLVNKIIRQHSAGGSDLRLCDSLRYCSCQNCVYINML